MIETIKEWAGLVLWLCSAVGLLIFKLREHYFKSGTDHALQKAQQARAHTVEEVQGADQANAEHYRKLLDRMEAREKDLTEQNTAVRHLFELALDKFRKELEAASLRIGELIEDVAELRGQDANCQRELNDLRAQIVRLEIVHNEEKRTLNLRIHNLANAVRVAGGNLSATDMMGPKQ